MKLSKRIISIAEIVSQKIVQFFFWWLFLFGWWKQRGTPMTGRKTDFLLCLGGAILAAGFILAASFLPVWKWHWGIAYTLLTILVAEVNFYKKKNFSARAIAVVLAWPLLWGSACLRRKMRLMPDMPWCVLGLGCQVIMLYQLFYGNYLHAIIPAAIWILMTFAVFYVSLLTESLGQLMWE